MPRPGFLSILALVLAPTLSASRVVAQGQAFRLSPTGELERTSAPAPGSDEATIAEARRDLAEDRPSEARRILDTFLDKYKNEDNPFLPEAYLLRGDAITALGKEHKALYDYEKVIERFPDSPQYVVALERELDIAIRYVNGLRYKFLGLRIADASDIGEELLIRCQERLPGSRLAERAGIELADFYYRKRDLQLAGEAYELFLANYPQSPYRMKAMERRVYAAIGRFKGPRYDSSSLIDAQTLIRRFEALYPTEAAKAGLDDSLLARLDESAAAELLEVARWYIKQGDSVSARYTLTRLIARHRRTASAETALTMLQSRGWLPTEAPGDESPGAPDAASQAPASSPVAPKTAKP
jgi:outer membrane protein assembly factor BamD (BamD/ComL family)